MQDFTNLCNVHSYISASQLISMKMQAFVLKLFSVNSQKEQTAKSNIHSVLNAQSLCLSFSTRSHSRAKRKGSSSPGERSTLAQCSRLPPPTRTALSEWVPALFPLGRSHTAAVLQDSLLSHLSSQPTNNLWKFPWKLPAILPHGHFFRRAIIQLLLGRFLWRSSGLTSQLHQQENCQY